MVENFDIKEEVFVLMTKKRLVSLMMSMGFILVALHNLGEKLSFRLQCLNLIGLCLFLFLMCTIIKDIRSDK
ncbi:hypothetical protein AWB63_07815 [Streptococcus salivarius]|nr:membrane protein [Streptococcus salivarius]AMB83315.1 hypothetical protein AWB63_07815 [Streptococcus salivarius]